jgi:hypothetical protein
MHQQMISFALVTAMSHTRRSQFDVVLTFEERVMDVTVEHLMATQRGGGACNLQPVLVINLDIKDSAEEAAIMAPQALRLCNMVGIGQCIQGGLCTSDCRCINEGQQWVGASKTGSQGLGGWVQHGGLNTELHRGRGMSRMVANSPGWLSGCWVGGW